MGKQTEPLKKAVKVSLFKFVEEQEAKRKEDEEKTKKAAEVEAALSEIREAVAELRNLALAGETGMGLRMAKMRVAKATKAAQELQIDQEIIVDASQPPPAPPEPEKPTPDQEMDEQLKQTSDEHGKSREEKN